MKNFKRSRNGYPLYRSVFRIVDRTAFALLCAASLWIPFRHKAYITVACISLMIAVWALLILTDKRNDANREAEQLNDTKASIRFEKLLLMKDAEIGKALGEPRLVLVRKTDTQASDVMEAIRTGARCILVCGDPERFRPVLMTHAPDIRLLDACSAAEQIGMTCTDREAKERLCAVRESRKKRRRIHLSLDKSRLRYFVLGILLLVLSFVWKHKIYYRLLSTVCFAIPLIERVFIPFRSRLNFGKFLDNRDK